MRSVLVAVVVLAFLNVAFGQYPTDAGFIQVDAASNANLYFYYLKSQGNPTTDPVVLWLQGGPGCSSLFGLYVENGPYMIKADGSFKENPYTWTKNASVIWIDSPVGTGYSYVNNDDYPSDEQTISNDLYTALYTFFFKLHPELAKLPFYIFGESYAGKYVPWLASTVLKQNQKAPQKINLVAIGIGDGWVNPYYQSGSWAPFLYRNNLINEVELEVAAGIYDTYIGLLDAHAFEAADVVGNSLLNGLMTASGVGDPYDIRKDSDPTDPLQDALYTWLNLADTQQKLNASNQVWQACADGPYFALEGDIEQSSAFLLPNILTQIPVLLYNGDKDLICDLDGTSTWATQLVWPYQSQFTNAKNQTWVVNGQSAGWYRGASTLVQVAVYNAGHMVPYDQPRNAQDLLYRFISGGFKP